LLASSPWKKLAVSGKACLSTFAPTRTRISGLSHGDCYNSHSHILRSLDQETATEEEPAEPAASKLDVTPTRHGRTTRAVQPTRTGNCLSVLQRARPSTVPDDDLTLIAGARWLLTYTIGLVGKPCRKSTVSVLLAWIHVVSRKCGSWPSNTIIDYPSYCLLSLVLLFAQFSMQQLCSTTTMLISLSRCHHGASSIHS
jgi:hypothetical protein